MAIRHWPLRESLFPDERVPCRIRRPCSVVLDVGVAASSALRQSSKTFFFVCGFMFSVLFGYSCWMGRQLFGYSCWMSRQLFGYSCWVSIERCRGSIFHGRPHDCPYYVSLSLSFSDQLVRCLILLSWDLLSIFAYFCESLHISFPHLYVYLFLPTFFQNVFCDFHAIN